MSELLCHRKNIHDSELHAPDLLSILFNRHPLHHRRETPLQDSGPPMPPFMNEPIVSLGGHGDSVTTTNFSPDGVYLASGSEDGLVLIHSVVNWMPLLRFIDASPVTSLTWHPRLQRVFFCGCKSGDVHAVRFSTSGVCPCISAASSGCADIRMN